MKIAHLADLHIGHPQYGIARRREAHNQNIIELGRQLARQKYYAVLVAGDIFDSNSDLLPQDIGCWCDFYNTVNAAGAKVIYKPGNHDRLYGQEVQWSDLGEKCGARQNSTGTRIEKDIKILSFPHYKRRYLGEVVESIEKCDVLMMHQSCVNFLPSIAKPEISEEYLSVLTKKCRYLALGDLHVHRKMKVGDTWVAYPGNPDFLRLGDIVEGFSYYEVDIMEDSITVTSVPIEQKYKTTVCRVEQLKKLKPEFLKGQGNFWVVEIDEGQQIDPAELSRELYSRYGTEDFLVRKKKTKKVSQESDPVSAENDSDFLDLVKEKENLEDEAFNLVEELWKNASQDSVCAALKQDMEREINNED